jgi:hypothetical protein
MERYRQEIMELKEKLTTRKPIEVQEQREKCASGHVESIAHEVKEVA